MTEIIVSTSNEVSVIKLSGNIDEQGAEKLKETFAALSLDNLQKVIVEFDNVDFIGSSGIGKLLLFYKNLSVKGGKLEVSGLSVQVYDLFRELKLDTIFSIKAA